MGNRAAGPHLPTGGPISAPRVVLALTDATGGKRTITLLVGVEAGVSSGVLISLLLHLFRTSRPHLAEVGLVPGTEHFRNIHRFKVETDPSVLSLRIDESLYFANTRYLEDLIFARVWGDSDLRHVILMCSAVNAIDLSALETLETLDQRLRDMGVTLNLSEVKSPVMDRLRKTDFLSHLNGAVFVSQFEAWCKLTKRCATRDLHRHAQGAS